MRSYDWSSGGACSSKQVGSPSPEFDWSVIDPQLRPLQRVELAAARTPSVAAPGLHPFQYSMSANVATTPSQILPHPSLGLSTDFAALSSHYPRDSSPPIAPGDVLDSDCIGRVKNPTGAPLYCDTSILSGQTEGRIDSSAAGVVLKDHRNHAPLHRDTFHPSCEQGQLPPLLASDTAALSFEPPPLNTAGVLTLDASATLAQTEDGKENAAMPAAPKGPAQSAQARRREKRPRAEPEQQDSTSLPQDVKREEPLKKRPRRAGSAPAQAEAPSGARKRRGNAELEKSKAVGHTRCGLRGCGVMLHPRDQAGAHRHARGHYKGAKSYICSYESPSGEKCSSTKSYSNLQGLSRHVESIHYKWRVFECKKCGEKFARRDVLKTHERTCGH
ncbi:hypothetical protein BV20DRAFT_574558 [Pilatotrama ljubarskyi]|nr:hypothetical protein BV20DRAFT_574558 [Pilatotrama ljubarskyi]